MSTKNWFWGIVEAVLWYLFVYQVLVIVKDPSGVDVSKSALLLIVNAYAAAVACPLLRNSSGWRRVWHQQ